VNFVTILSVGGKCITIIIITTRWAVSEDIRSIKVTEAAMYTVDDDMMMMMIIIMMMMVKIDDRDDDDDDNDNDRDEDDDRDDYG